jgi:hypothetical protein
LSRVGWGQYDMQRAVGVDVADLATGDLTVGVDRRARCRECRVNVRLEVTAPAGQRWSGGDKRCDGESGCEVWVRVLIELSVRDRVWRDRRSRPGQHR